MKECLKCEKTKLLHKHHVTYDPEVIKWLCRICHGLITSINTKIAINRKRKLSNNLREYLFDIFLKIPLHRTNTKKILLRQVTNRINRDRSQKKLLLLDPE